MFDGVPVPDQFHQFIGGGASSATARTATTTLLLPLSFTSFDPLFTSSSSNSHHHQPSQLLQSLHQQKNSEDANTSLVPMNMEINERDQRSMAEPIDHHHQHQPWSNDEVLALLRVRSSMEPWFPEFTWEHVSRKVAELGFKRSAEKCKEKFEEENRYFNTINCSKNYRIFTELDELCQAENPPPHHHNSISHHHQEEEKEAVVVSDESNKNVEEEDNIGQNLEGDSRNVDELYQNSPANNNAAMSSDQDNKNVVENKGDDDDNKASSKNKNSNSNKKRKRVTKLEIFKGFCEEIVNNLMIQQEEMHNKLLEDMVKRDEEEVAREEAWKKQELDRINQELEVRSKEQAIAGDRQATIIKFLTKFSQNGCSNPPLAASSSSLPVAENPNPIANDHNKVAQVAENQANQNPNPKTPTPQNPNSLLTPLKVTKAPKNPTSYDKEDIGKRWPRDEVSALIKLRCSLYNNGDHHDKEGAAIKAPLWERISQGMLDLGYKRSAKRCKEKWENINKYFRKTKYVNRKRSLDSRTCPYFHQLSTLYNQGTLRSPSEEPENHPPLPETASTDLSRRVDDKASMQVSKGDETNNIIQIPDFEFEL
ncbi:NIMA-related serine/threonine kinase 1 isoform 1 [Hibiscus syriacus]|uniref:NIMA-related serine/threonine kinase 1 isoform 1 n=1 Tax=Hibiscus syriacus TaxID=106335 RepID=A0A6A3CIZ2_HIBSY|nr:trihelix transcription factor GTL2-like [Hibiscus syriacus]KAE8729123.1 NIMA-related serine/threonine kinase 1 isoform 1 [Hibiscus syriacus]